MKPPKLIEALDVLAQADVLDALQKRLADLPKLPQNPSQAWIFVAEGSSYNAVQWQMTQLIQAHPRQRAILFYPWELEASLGEWQAVSGEV
ncbi:MAG: hypothetical protein ACK5T0_09090, partial [Vampirovibrionales bacterium]